VHTARSLRLWENKNGFPYKKSEHAHLSDAVGYGCYRLWGRPAPKREPGPGYSGAKRFTRGQELRGIFGSGR
jgi:hypothetical protein